MENPPRTPEEIERDWLENVYAGDLVPQLTGRAVVTGMVWASGWRSPNCWARCSATR